MKKKWKKMIIQKKNRLIVYYLQSVVTCGDHKLLSDRTVTVCTGVLLASEWWALEIAIMMGGLLPDAALQLSAMAIYNSTNDLCLWCQMAWRSLYPQGKHAQSDMRTSH